MNRRQRCIAALEGRIPDRPPISFDISPENLSDNLLRVYKYFGANDQNGIYLTAGIDGFSVWNWSAIVGKYIGKPKTSADGVKLDFWGNFYPGHFGLYPCDSVALLRHHRWPEVSDFDFSHIRDKALEIQNKDMTVAAGHISLGYQMHHMLRGHEKALYDLADPAYMEVYMSYLEKFTLEYLQALLKAGSGLIDVVRADDDIGMMDRLMISPQMWRKYYKSAWKKAFDVVHKYGAKVWFHSCGCIMPLMDDLIEIGVDCWNPFPDYVKGNDHAALRVYRKGRLAIDGGVSHLVLINGNSDDVRNDTKRVLDTFAPDGGLLIGPSQAITADMPTENIIAMLETAIKYK